MALKGLQSPMPCGFSEDSFPAGLWSQSPGSSPNPIDKPSLFLEPLVNKKHKKLAVWSGRQYSARAGLEEELRHIQKS